MKDSGRENRHFRPARTQGWVGHPVPGRTSTAATLGTGAGQTQQVFELPLGIESGYGGWAGSEPTLRPAHQQPYQEATI